MFMNKFLELPRARKQLIAAFADLLFLPLTFIFSIWLRYDGFDTALFIQYVSLIVSAPLISIPIFIKLGLYRAVIRFIDQKIIYVVVLGVTISVVCMAAAAALTHTSGLARTVFLIYWVSAILYVVSSRFLARGYFLRKSYAGNIARGVAIYGAGRSGVQLASALRAGNEYLPVAFIDDAKERQGTIIAGIKVYSPKDLPRLVTKLRIKEILLAMPSLKKTQQKRVLDSLEPLKIKIKVAPSIKGLMNGTLRLQDIREIEIEDLLGRDAVEPHLGLISACISGKTVLVSGAGGSIGSELCRQIVLLRPERLVLLEMSEFGLYAMEQELQGLVRKAGSEVKIVPFLGSVIDQEKCTRIMKTFSVDTVYHAAAYKHVPLVEHNPIEGVRNNVFGTLSLARAAMDAGVKCFVLISTDKAVRPTNVMGATKRLAEMILQAFARTQSSTRFCMVRFGNVLGSSGSVVPLFRKQIMSGGPITVTHPEITRYFMTIGEAAQLVLQAGAMGTGGDVFVLDMGEPVKIVDLARRMVHLSGFEVKGDGSPDGGIEIRHVGLRPGEKLYEELLIGANAEGTEHPLIMRAQEEETPWDVVDEFLNKLEYVCGQFDYQSIRSLLQHMVTDYLPQCGIEDLIWQAQSETSAAAHGPSRPLSTGAGIRSVV
jgi:FlaA1/EpsC-like NDP-sugar epimerase